MRAAVVSLGLTLGLAAGAAPLPAVSQEAPAAPSGEARSARIAVVNVQLLIRQSAAAQSIQRQGDSLRGQFQKEFGALEDRLRRSEQDLARLRTTLSPEQFDERRQAFEREVAELRRGTQERYRAMETSFKSAEESVLTVVEQLVGEVAREKGATLVIPRQAVAYLGDPALDITETVLSRLNERLPQVTVELKR